MTRKPFPELMGVMSAVVRREGAELEQFLSEVDPQWFVPLAIRHKCAGMIWAAATDARLRIGRRFERMRSYAALAMAENMTLHEQAMQASEALCAAGVDHVRLKGSARLAADAPGAWFTHHFDIDFLVRGVDGERAFRTLVSTGYASRHVASAAEWYRQNHHHLAPLERAGGKPLELHVALAPPGQQPFATDWNALEEHIVAETGRRFRFDRLAQALHLIVHGIDSGRLHDVAALAVLLEAEPGLREAIAAWLGDAEGNVPVQTVLAMADRLRGAGGEIAPAAARYQRWVERREQLPHFLRDRSQFVDAWHENGGRLIGPATFRSFAASGPYERATMMSRTVAAARAVGRMATSAAAATIANWL